MNKYQFSVIWIAVIIVIVILCPFVFFFLNVEVSMALIIYAIIVTFLVGITLFFSLKGKNDEEVKEKYLAIKKYLIIICCLVSIIPLYFLGTLIINQIEEYQFESKKKLLIEYISNPNWLENNIILLDASLEYKEIPERKLSRVNSLNATILNRSPLDLTNIKVLIKISEGENLISKETIDIWENIQGESRKIISKYIPDSGIKLVPNNFTWTYEIVSVIPSNSYISGKSKEELVSYINNDTIKVFLDYNSYRDSNSLDTFSIRIDWDAFERNQDSLGSLPEWMIRK